MHKIVIRALTVIALVAAATLSARAAADRQSFWGFGPGFEVLSQTGSGTGFYIQGFGGYNFTEVVGLGLHAGYSNIGTVHVSLLDFGLFGQFTDPESGLYGKLYLDGANASVDGGGTSHGINGSQLGFTPGVGLGMLIPTAGDFHMAPELAYRAGFFENVVNLITTTFNVIWDF